MNITIELDKKDRALLEDIVGHLGTLVGELKDRRPPVADFGKVIDFGKAIETAQEPQEAPKAEAPEITHPVEEESPFPDVPPAAPGEEKPAVNIEQIQQKVVQLAAANNGAKKAKVREIVNTYARKVSDIPEAKWSEVWDKLTALEVNA